MSTPPQFEYFIEPLRATHDRANFSCGAEALDIYLRRQARQDVSRRIAAVFVLTPDGTTVAGYYSLSAVGVALTDLPGEVAKKLPRYPVLPATLLGRLAVEERHHGRGLGEFLLLDALRRAWEHSVAVASFAVVVDAKDAAARAFYEKYGFITCAGTTTRLFLPMKTIERLFRK